MKGITASEGMAVCTGSGADGALAAGAAPLSSAAMDWQTC
jgi:hypothetical protein